MKRQMMTRKRMPRITVNASHVSLCFRKSSMISGVKFSCKNIFIIQTNLIMKIKNL